MSDPIATAEAEAEAETATPDAPAQETDWKAEARKWEQRAKENLSAARTNEGAAKRLAEIEDAAKTDLEKAAARAEQAEQRLAALEAERQIATWKTEVAEKTGVPAAALSGSSLEEITAHANVLAPLIRQPGKGPIVPNAGETPTQMALNGDGITDSLKRALNIP